MALRPSIRTLGKHSFIFGVGNISTKLVAFLLIPIYTKFLTTSEVGTVALIELLELVFIQVGSMGIGQAVWRQLSMKRLTNNHRVIISGFVFLIVLNFFLLGFISLFKSSIANFLGITDNQYQWWVYLILMNTFFQFAGNYLLLIWQYYQKSTYYVLFSLFQLVSTLLLTLYFVVNKSMGLLGIIQAKTFVLFFLFIISTLTVIYNHKSVPSIPIIKKLLKFGLPLVAVTFITPVLTMADRFFLNMFVPLSLIGIYSINYKFGMLINMFLITPFQRGLMPIVFREGLNNEMRPIYRDIMFYYIIIGCFFVLGITFFIPPLISWVSSSEYLKVSYIVPIISVAYLIGGFRPFFIALLGLKNRTDLLGKTAIFGISISLIITFFLIKFYGILGAAIATVLSYISIVLIEFYLANRVNPMNWGWPRIGKVVLLTAGIIAGVHIAGSKWDGLDLVFGFIGLASFPILLWAFRIIGEREINGMKSIISFVQNKVSKS